MLNIAICDDMLLQRELVKILIQEYEIQNCVRFNIYQFESGEKFLEKFLENTNFFDLIFLDNIMKNLTGLQTAINIRSYNKTIHIVFITASEETNFQEVSPLKVIIKPVQIEFFYKILDTVLSWEIVKKII